MPDYSKLEAERDVFGELGWIPNFSVKNSKNNEHRHDGLREYFDKPRNYNVEFAKTLFNTETFFDSVAEESISLHKSRRSGSPSLNETQSFAQTQRSINALERVSYAKMRRTSGFAKNTGFLLEKDTQNKYHVNKELQKTVKVANQIPFLRDCRDTDNVSVRKFKTLD